MENKTISNETLEKIKLLPRLNFDAFKLLVTQNQVKCFIKFKIPRTVFYDETDGFFYYLNPYHKHLQKCGQFIESN